LLGNPDDELNSFMSDTLFMIYYRFGVVISIELPNANSDAFRVWIYRS